MRWSACVYAVQSDFVISLCGLGATRGRGTKSGFSAPRNERLCTQFNELLGQSALVVVLVVPRNNAALETGTFGAFSKKWGFW
jgi:hypothetical protein